MRNAVVSLLVIFLLGGATQAELRCRDPAHTAILSELYAEIIPGPGTKTAYGIPLSLWNISRFASWYGSVKLSSREAAVYEQALGGLVTPVCEDLSLSRCCLPGSPEAGSKTCEFVRSAQGLAKWLIRKGFFADEVRAAVDQWLHFIFPSYFLSLALQERGIDPTSCGLPVAGVCCKGCGIQNEPASIGSDLIPGDAGSGGQG